MFKTIYIALFAAALAAAIAVPVENDVETSEEWGSVGNALSSTANKFSSWIKGKECQLRKCPGCQTKKRRSFGRRMLSDSEFWKTSTYKDCSIQNKCLAENAQCNGKISALQATVDALNAEIVEAKKVASTHKDKAADLKHAAELKQQAADAAKTALEDHQKHIANLARALAAELKAQADTRDAMNRAVQGTASAIKDAKEEHADKAEELKEWNEKQAAPAKAEADAAQDVKNAEQEHAAQVAKAKDANDRMAARVAAARRALKEAEDNLKGFSDRHHAAEHAAAGSASAAAQAKALADLKQASVEEHQSRLKSVNKRIEMNLETSEKWGKVGNALGSAGTKMKAWLKGKECELRKCGGCVEKKKRSFGRRMLSEADAEWWKTTTYTDCSTRNSCLAENARCTAKIGALDAAVKALDAEIAAAKAIADEHGASVADKKKVSEAMAAAAAVAKKELEDHQTHVANLAHALASERKAESDANSRMASAVRNAGHARKEASEEHEDAKKELAKAAAAESKSAQEKAKAEAAEQEQIAEAAKEKQRYRSRVGTAKYKLGVAEAALQSFADKHHAAERAAAESSSAHAAAKALHDLKLESVHSLKQKREATAKKISW